MFNPTVGQLAWLVSPKDNVGDAFIKYEEHEAEQYKYSDYCITPIVYFVVNTTVPELLK